MLRRAHAAPHRRQRREIHPVRQEDDGRHAPRLAAHHPRRRPHSAHGDAGCSMPRRSAPSSPRRTTRRSRRSAPERPPVPPAMSTLSPAAPAPVRPTFKTWVMAIRPKTLHRRRGAGGGGQRARLPRRGGARCCPRWRRCWARCSSRSAPTSPTTTTTSRRARTPPSGWAPRASPRAGSTRPRASCWRRRSTLRARRLCGPVPRRRWAAGRSSPSACCRCWRAYAYTGGPYPLGYHGLGDVFVFVFFGLVAVTGTYYVQAGRSPRRRGWRPSPWARIGTRAPRRQQPARREHRREGRQAHAGGAPGRRAGRAEYIAMLSRRLPHPRAAVAHRPCPAVGAAGAAVPAGHPPAAAPRAAPGRAGT